MNLYPSVPLCKFQFGSAVTTPPLIRLSNHGIVGLSSVKGDTFYLSQYDDHGTVRHTITPIDFIQRNSYFKVNYFNGNTLELLIEESTSIALII